MTPTPLAGPATSPNTRSRIPAVYAIAVTIDSGETHLVGDDVYTVSMVMLGHRPYAALCGEQVRHASPTTRPGDMCEECTAVAVRCGLRRSDRRVAGIPTVGPSE